MRKEVILGVGMVIATILIIAVLSGFSHAPEKSPPAPSTPPLPFQGSLAGNGYGNRLPWDLPAGDDFVAISSWGHILALRSNGTIACLGSNMYGGCDVPDEGNFTAVSAGDDHSLALRPDGTVACWGDNRSHECDVPGEHDFVAISAGYRFSLALRTNGTIACWGEGLDGDECAVPPGNDFLAISAGWPTSLALRSDGTIACWGSNQSCNEAPGHSYVAISASKDLSPSLALTSEGTLEASDPYIGWNYYVPPGNDFVAISADHGTSLALRSDGTTVCWGFASFHCGSLPSAQAIAISAGNPGLAITNPRAGEILAAEWQKTRARITSKTGEAGRIQPRPSREPVYPADYVINATMPEVPDVVMVYTMTFKDEQSLEEQKQKWYYRFTLQEMENDPARFKPYREFPVKTPEEALGEFRQHRFELVDSSENYRGPVGQAEKIVVTNISFGYQRNTLTLSGPFILQPFYSFEGYVRKGNRTAPFVTDEVPATDNLVGFDFMNALPTVEITPAGTTARPG